MTLTCGICSAACKRTESIICTVCNASLHYNCFIKETPGMAQSVKDSLSKTKTGFIYGCKQCMTTSSMSAFNNKFDALDKQLQDLTNVIKESVTSQLSEIKTDLAKSLTRSKNFEEYTDSKLANLERENNNIRKQLNRSDIIVTGIPADDPKTANLYDVAISLGKACDVNISEYDVNFCTWIKKKSAVLIKFNSVFKRDNIMKNYRANYSLTLNQVIETDIESRIFLNDHYTPIISKLHYICRQKVKSGEVKSYRIYNSDPIKVKLVYKNKKDVEVNYMDLINNTPSVQQNLQSNLEDITQRTDTGTAHNMEIN